MSKNKQPSSLASPAVDESSVAWKLFCAFINDPQTTITEDELRSYAINELKLCEEAMSQELKDNLPVILLAFMNMWSGWHFKNEFIAGKIDKDHYFGRFQKFMVHKMQATIKTNFNAAMKAVGEQLKSTANVRNEPDFAPYSILIQCPPSMLNTIVFSNSGDDVIMKQHLGSSWQDLSTVQLLNWPFVEVLFRTEDFCLGRRQATEFVRYLNFLPHESNKHSDNVVEHVESLPNYAERNRTCYSYNFLEKYGKSYIQALKSTYSELDNAKVEEISAILTQFLEDVKFIDVNNSIPTNTSILFRLSKVPFIRNKKLVKNSEKVPDEARVGYCEIITPKVELVLMYCKAKQVMDADIVTFEYIEKIKSKTRELKDVLPYITYKCTFCRAEFKEQGAKKGILNHLQNEHKMEQHVRCTMCKKQFDVLNLAACRWRHKCIPCKKQ